jgi:hypothetical protein
MFTKIREFSRTWYSLWLLWLSTFGLGALIVYLFLLMLQALWLGAQKVWTVIRWDYGVEIVPQFFNSWRYRSWKEHRNAR